MVIKQERRDALERQIARLTRRIIILDQRSNRYSWARVALFFSGIALTLIASIAKLWWLAVVFALLATIVFSAVAYFQGKIDRSIVRHKVWSSLKGTHLARMRLDWENIPAVRATSLLTGHPFADRANGRQPRSLPVCSPRISNAPSLGLRFH